jgi:hypothetical protein
MYVPFLEPEVIKFQATETYSSLDTTKSRDIIDRMPKVENKI